jgi:hypothetical protein
MVRSDRQMSDGEAREFLRQHSLAHLGTTEAVGQLFVVPLGYV